MHAVKWKNAVRTAAAALALAALAAPTGAWSSERAIEREVVVPATLEQTWAAWTTREGIVSFFAPDAEIEPRVGGAFHIFMDPSAAPGMKGADEMRYLALQPRQMISFDWNAPPSLPEARAQRTVVIVRFEPVGETQTRVKLHHTGWGTGGQWDQTYAYFDKAWPSVLENLRKRFETGPRDWAPWLEQLKAYKAQAAAAQAASAVPAK
jgi:uncharacterized protein YndB with AHSA1/START domain